MLEIGPYASRPSVKEITAQQREASLWMSICALVQILGNSLVSPEVIEEILGMSVSDLCQLGIDIGRLFGQDPVC